MSEPEVCKNTDRELWRERPGDFYADSIHVTESGSIGIDVGGNVLIMPIRAWHVAGRKENAAMRALPNLVRQTTPTNCFRACVATVLDLPIEEVPAACDGETWDWDAFQDWLADRGLQMIEITFANGGTIYPVRRPVRCIITGKSHRECKSGQHAVVGSLLGLEGFSLDADPHPSDLWIDGEPTHAGFFVRIEQ